jgi:hypothetical protein
MKRTRAMASRTNDNESVAASSSKTLSTSVGQRQRRFTSQQALQKIQDLLATQSGSESDNDSDNENVGQTAHDEDFSSNESSVNEIESDESAEEGGREDSESNNDTSDESDDDSSKGSVVGAKDLDDNGTAAKIVNSKDGTTWKIITDGEEAGRLQIQNVFTAKSGTTPYSRTALTPIESFRLLIDEGMLRHIKTCTVSFARLTKPNWTMSDKELEEFIGLVYLRGAMNARNFPIRDMWSSRYGCDAFRKTMARDRFMEIKRYIRFDTRSTRSERLKDDKFCLISFVLSRFVANSQRSYIPEESLTIDEQLFPTKARCRFTQYMPNKPDKFGIKFWVLADLNTKYCLNIMPYLGKDEARVSSLGTHVVMSLMEPYYGRGYNVTTDNFFTGLDLARKLLQKKTSIVGTVRLNRREIPPSSRLALHESLFYKNDSVHVVKYQAKAKKTVVVLSTLHKGSARQQDGKKKPDSILYYNANKCGVDMLDAMCRQMSTKAGTRRWPLAVFFNILDMAGINSWIIFKKNTGINISRRNFMRQLTEQLTAYSSGTGKQTQTSEKLDKRVRCEVKSSCRRNLTSTLCISCKRPVCGVCLENICSDCSSS